MMSSIPITPVILCGGCGTRLWPLSRKLFPKQFVLLIDGKNLAIRVAYFNELDTYAVFNCLDTRQIIGGVCLAPELATTTKIPASATAVTAYPRTPNNCYPITEKSHKT
jgi:hypothetical protein